MYKTSNCEIRSNVKYNGYCFGCFASNPENVNNIYVVNRRTKEREVVNHIRQKFIEYEWVVDKTINGGTSHKRPDLLLDLGFQVIIVEIDEYQHGLYEYEQNRLIELSNDLQNRPLIVIRFNPDSYIGENRKRIPSCWKTTIMGTIVKETMQNDWNSRLDKLIQEISRWLIQPTEKTIEVIKLFYNVELVPNGRED